MRNIDFFEVKKRLNIDYCNKQIITSSEVTLIKEKINKGKISEISENYDNKHNEHEGTYLDESYCHNSFQLQPCIASEEKINEEPFFEMTFDIEFPSITYQVKKNTAFYNDVYSIIHSKYVNSPNNTFSFDDKIIIAESKPIFETDDFRQSFSIHWNGEDLLSSKPVLLGEISGIVQISDNKLNGCKSFEFPNISNTNYDIILDTSHLCNEFAFLKYYKLPFPFDDKNFKPNTQLQWLYINHWPHLVVLSIPGVRIKHGDELIVDFGEDYHEKYSQSNKELLKKILGIEANYICTVHICRVCNKEVGQDHQYLFKCSICYKVIHKECGYLSDTKHSSICCLICLKKSLSIIFGLNRKKIDCSYPEMLNNNNREKYTVQFINMFGEIDINNTCNNCLKTFSRKDTMIEKQKSAFICKVIHDIGQRVEKHAQCRVGPFYSDFNSSCGTDVKQINADVIALENFYSIFEKLVEHTREITDNKFRLFQNLQIDLLGDSYVGLYDHKANNIFSDPSVFDQWKKSKWKDFIYWDRSKKSWVGVLKPNGIKSYFTCSDKNSILENLFEAEKWVERRLSEAYITGGLFDVMFSYENKAFGEQSTSNTQEAESNILQHNYHSPFLPTDLASHPDYKVLLNSYESCKYQISQIDVDNCRSNCTLLTDSQIQENKIECQMNRNNCNSDLQLYTYSNTSNYLLSDSKHHVASTTGYIQCFSPVHRKRRVRSTLPLTSNAAKCPTEWRVRGITWHAERKAFIVPYRRDKDGGLTSTTFGAMKYGSPLTAFLKALEFRENYLKEQATKLPEEIKQPSVICDQALLIRNLPNIIWDSNKLVWRAIAEEDIFCEDDQTQKYNLGPQDVEVDATPYGARIAYEIAEVYYIRRKALLLNSKDSAIGNRTTNIGNRYRYKNTIGGIGVEYPILESQNISLANKNNQIINSSQNLCYKQIRLKIIFPSGKELIRDDLISWHFRTNSWVVSNVDEENESGCVKGLNSIDCLNSSFRHNSIVHSLISAIECCSSIPQKCQVFIHAEEAESIIESEELAELLKPFPTGISWYCKKRRFYTSNGLDSNGRGQHFSIALYGSLIAAFNAAIDYRNIFLKNRRKNILPKIEWVLCYPINLNTLNSFDNVVLKDSRLIHEHESSKKVQNNCKGYNLTNNYLNDCTVRNIERMNNQISSINECPSNDTFHSEGVWLQHPTTVSLLEDQMIDTQDDLDGQILNISILE